MAKILVAPKSTFEKYIPNRNYVTTYENNQIYKACTAQITNSIYVLDVSILYLLRAKQYITKYTYAAIKI